jgi:O-antigen ligase
MDNPKISFLILLGLILLIPQFIFPWADDSYLIPKFALLNFGIILLIYILFVSGRLNHFQRLTKVKPITVCLLTLYFLLNIISLIYATSIPLAIKEIGKWFFLILLYYIYSVVICNVKRLKILIYTLLLTGLITAIWVIFQDYHISIFRVLPRLPDWRGYLVAGLGNSDYVAGFLVSIFPMGLVVYATVTESKPKLFLLISLSIIYASLIVTFSVGANMGLIIGMIIVFGHMIYYRKQPGWFPDMRRWIWLVVIFAIITAFYVFPIPVNGRGESIFKQAFASNRWKEGGNTRLVIWANTWELIKSHPIRGIGAGNFTYNYLDYVAPIVLNNPKMRPYSGEYTNAAHNEIMHTWSELGLPGVIILLLLIFNFYYSSLKILINKSEIRNPKSEINMVPLPAIILGATGGLTAMAIYGLMSYPLHLPVTAMLFIFYLALPQIIINLINKSEFRSVTLAPSSYILASILFILLSLWAIRPLIADIYFRIGKEASKYNEEPAAITAFTLATQWDNHADAYYHLGELYLRGKEYGGKISTAIDQFEIAKKQRNDKNLLNELGIAYILTERYQEALACFKPLTQRQPDNPIYWDRLSYIYLKLGNPELSNEAHLKAEELK